MKNSWKPGEWRLCFSCCYKLLYAVENFWIINFDFYFKKEKKERAQIFCYVFRNEPILTLPIIPCVKLRKSVLFEFSLNVFTEFTFSLSSVTKIFVITANGLKPATSCVRDQDANTAPARHMWETGSLNWTQFMLQWFIRFSEFAQFSEFLLHLGKSPLKGSNTMVVYDKITNFISQ